MNRSLVVLSIALTACIPDQGGPYVIEDSGPGATPTVDAAWASFSPDAAARCPSKAPASCPPSGPSYQADIAPIIAAHCAPCHFPGNDDVGIQRSGYSLSSYANLVSVPSLVVTEVLSQCLMPPGAITDGVTPPRPLSLDEQVTFLTWLTCGEPNN
jgi:hypothetical protein